MKTEYQIEPNKLYRVFLSVKDFATRKEVQKTVTWSGQTIFSTQANQMENPVLFRVLGELNGPDFPNDLPF